MQNGFDLVWLLLQVSGFQYPCPVCRTQLERKHSLAEDESLTSQHHLAEAVLAENMYRFIPLRQLQCVYINRVN